MSRLIRASGTIHHFFVTRKRSCCVFLRFAQSSPPLMTRRLKRIEPWPEVDLFGFTREERARLAPPVRDNNAEARQQAAIVEYVRTVAPQIIIWHVPNGGLRDKAVAARLKWMGVLAGVLDLTLALEEGRCAFWECKRPKGGRLSDDQKEIIAKLESLGHIWARVLNIDDAKRELARLGVETREAA